MPQHHAARLSQVGEGDGTALRGERKRRPVGTKPLSSEEALTCYSFPDNHWNRMRTNNPLERIIREIRQRTHVVGAFPDGQLALMLCAAQLRHIAGTNWGTRRYLNMEALFRHALEPATA